ncbi:MAG TPA: PIN domain-containing protein [Anaerolineales bacterium]|nr:PIN domain-containing protein [Anaerolineales bacterium]
MSKIKVFLDSSALIAGVISSTGAARVLLVMSETGQIEVFISEHVLTEAERSLARKVPQALPEFRQSVRDARPKIVQNPTQQEIKDHLYLISDPGDVPILLSAMKAKVDFLATHNRRHFLDDPSVAEKTELKIGTPGDVLVWLRDNL